MQEDEGAVLVRAVAAGLAAAIAGGVLWGLIVRWTEYEVGIVAWAIGFIVGTAVVLAAGGARGLRLQVAAVVSALLGILVGKYLSFVWGVNDAAAEEGVPLELSLLSSDTVDAFVDSGDIVWSWFDLLWIGLAIVTAFRIPQREDVRVDANAEPRRRDTPAAD